MEFLANLKRHTKAVNVCRFSPDGRFSEEQIRVFDDNLGIIFHKKICCGFSLESPQRDDSNEYPQSIL